MAKQQYFILCNRHKVIDMTIKSITLATLLQFYQNTSKIV